MRKLDQQEFLIVRELIRNPRISDNQLSKRTKVPVMTVNRKRKRLESEGLLYYFTYFNTADPKTGIFRARQLFIIKFKIGITREQYLEAIKNDKRFREFNAKFHVDSFLGEKGGHLSLIIILDSNSEAEVVEAFNGEVIPALKKRYGDDCIAEVITARLDLPIRMHHNYLPMMNMQNGILKEEWSDEWIYVERGE